MNGALSGCDVSSWLLTQSSLLSVWKTICAWLRPLSAQPR